MRIQSWQRSLFLLLALLTAARVLRAASVTIEPSADTSLFEDAPTNNLGGLDMLVTGTTAIGFRSRALIKFDIAGHLPANATVTNALLRLTAVRTPSSGGKDSIFGLHRVVQDWEEGDKAGTSLGAPATTGDTTWNSRFHPSTSWSVAGGSSPDDYVEVATSAQLIRGLGQYAFTGLNGDAQFWLTNATSNFGWILISQDEASPETNRRFASREATTQTTRPELVLEYTAISQPRIGRVDLTGDQLQLRFTVEASYCYDLQFRDLLAAGSWATLTNICSGLLNTDVVASVTVTNAPARFYRLAVNGRVP